MGIAWWGVSGGECVVESEWWGVRGGESMVVTSIDVRY